MNPFERQRRFLVAARMVGRIYTGYKAVQLFGRLAGERWEDDIYRWQHRRAAELIYKTAAEMQGLLIKSCQFIGTRADILPEEYIEVLSRLQDRVPPRPFSIMKPVIEGELKKPLRKVFAELDPEPIAAASLAQVHRGVLRDGREVAVKVQYPNIADLVATDLANFSFIVDLLARIETSFDLRLVVRELSRYVPLELDFVHEAENAERIRANLASRGDVVVPAIHREYSGRRVLVMEFMPGIKVTDLDGLARAGIDKREVARILTEVYCRKILIDGFFQADPHPGNVLVQPGPRIVLLDFGLAKDFPPGFRDGILRLVAAILSGDAESVAEAFRGLGFRTRNGDDGASLVALGEAFLGRAARAGRAFPDRSMIEQINEELPRALRANPIVEAPPDLILVVRVMGLLAGINKQLDSDLDPMQLLMGVMGAVPQGAD